MKRALVYLFGAIMLLASCNAKTEDLSYVADIQINDELTRSELVRLHIDRQREIFNDLTPEMKTLLYKYKMTKDIEEADLNDAEKAMLTELKNSLTPDSYGKDRDKFNKYGEEWISRAQEQLGWDEEKLFRYTMIIMTSAEFDEYKMIDFQ